MVTWERIIICNNPDCRKEISRAPVRDVDVYYEMINRVEVRPAPDKPFLELVNRGESRNDVHLCSECLAHL